MEKLEILKGAIVGYEEVKEVEENDESCGVKLQASVSNREIFESIEELNDRYKEEIEILISELMDVISKLPIEDIDKISKLDFFIKIYLLIDTEKDTFSVEYDLSKKIEKESKESLKRFVDFIYESIS